MSTIAINVASNVEINFAAGTISLFNKTESTLVKDAKILSYFRVGTSRGMVTKPEEDSEHELRVIIPDEIEIMHDPENYPEEWNYPRYKTEFTPGTWEAFDIIHISDVQVINVNGKEFTISFMSDGRFYPSVTCDGALLFADDKTDSRTMLYFFPLGQKYELTKMLHIYSILGSEKKENLLKLPIEPECIDAALKLWQWKQPEENKTNPLNIQKDVYGAMTLTGGSDE